MKYRIGVDVGGTFTDLVLIDIDGNYFATKASSTIEDQSVGVMESLDRISKQCGVSLQEILKNTIYFGHGSTVATNACVEHKGAITGLLTTRGFRDVLYIARQSRAFMYDLFQNRTIPLTPRHRTYEITERIDSEGTVRAGLNEEEVREAVQNLKKQRVESISVCYLFSWKNPIHEKRTKEIIFEEFPEVYVTISSELAPVFRDYERTSTTEVNSYVGPVMRFYLSNLRERLMSNGLGIEPAMMTSFGGIVSLEEACISPSTCLASGPAAGVVGAIFISDVIGERNLITFDMGGTTTDVSLVNDGQPEFVIGRKYDLGHGDIHPVVVPIINIHSIGAGGGSVGWVDSGGALRVGPHSQGAMPGPACYNLGGTEVCVTDANLFQGYLNPDYFCGGDLIILPELSRKAIEEKIGKKLKMSTSDVSAGIYDIVNTNMVNAVRVISVERGYDPRDYTFVSFGAAGSTHVARMMQELDVRKAIIPPLAGGLSALGLLSADIGHYYVQSLIRDLDQIDSNTLDNIYKDLEKRGKNLLQKEGVSLEKIKIFRMADIRYMGQSHEVLTPVPSGKVDDKTKRIIYDNFTREHERLYNHKHLGDPVEVVSLRVHVAGVQLKPKIIKLSSSSEISPEKALKAKRNVFWKEYREFVETPIYERHKMLPNNRLEGPAIIEEPLTTTIVPPGIKAEIDLYNNIILTL